MGPPRCSHVLLGKQATLSEYQITFAQKRSEESPERLRIWQRNGAKRSPDRLHGQMTSRGRLRDRVGRDISLQTHFAEISFVRESKARDGLLRLQRRMAQKFADRERDSKDRLFAARLLT